MAEQTATQPLNLRAKLSMVYARVDHIEKSGRNAKQNYDYVRSADVLHAIRKALIEYRVYAETNFDLLSTYDIKTNSGGNMHTATVKAFIVFHDLDSDERITGSGLGDGADGGDKGIYKAQTGAIKNALRNSFLVPDSADPEADQSVDEATQEQPRIAPTAKGKLDVEAEFPKDSATAAVGSPVIASGGPLPTPWFTDVKGVIFGVLPATGVQVMSTDRGHCVRPTWCGPGAGPGRQRRLCDCRRA